MTWKWLDRRFRAGEAMDAAQPRWTVPDGRLPQQRRILMMLIDVREHPQAASALEYTMRGEAPLLWQRLDEPLRRLTWLGEGYAMPAWLRAPKDVQRLALPAGTEGVVVGLLAAHRSGYVREAAVWRLGRVRDGSEVPPLLVRANDWVPQVRQAALEALHARLDAAYAEHWVAALPLVLRLRGTGRVDGRSLVNAVLEMLGTSQARTAVWQGMEAYDAGTRRAAFRILLDTGPRGLFDVFKAAMRSHDEMIRLEAARAAAPLDDGTLLDVLPAMLADPFPRVRAAAIPLAEQRMGHAALARLREMLLDRVAAIRAAARAAIQSLDPIDFADFYRAHVSSGAPGLAEAVVGLAETGGSEDAERIAPLLAHPHPRVRAAAVRALPRLTGDAAVPALVRALGDASPGVSRAAAEALLPRVQAADAGALEEWMRPIHPAHVRRRSLRLLGARSKWDGIAWIIRASGDGDAAVRQVARDQLSWWLRRFNRVQTQPTPEQRGRIRAALEAGPSAIDPEAAKILRFSAGLRG